MPDTHDSGCVATALGVESRQWDELAQRSGSVFLTREWLGTWWRHKQRNLPVSALQEHGPDGQLVGLLPIVRSRRWPRVLRPLGQWPAPALSVICGRDELEQRAAQLAERLNAQKEWDVFQADAVPAALSLDPGSRGAFCYDRQPNFVLDYDNLRWDDWLATRSSNFRDQLKKRERRLERQFTVVYRRADDPERLEQDVDELFRLHHLRWGSETLVLDEGSRAFHRDIVAQALARGWLSFWFLELDQKPVAALLNFRFGNREQSYQSGRDPAYEAHSVGLALTVRAIRAAADAGASEFQFLRGPQEFKRRLANRNEPVETRLMARNVRGAGLVGMLCARKAKSGGVLEVDPH